MVRKKNNRRIDAAIAALGKGGLGPGFPQDVVRKTINNLLKVYGGDDGWAFLEENSYLLVIEAILENQETSEKGGDDAQALEAVEQVVEDGEPSSHLLLPAEDEPSRLQCVADSEQHPLVPADSDSNSHPGVAAGEGSSLVPVLADVNWREISCTDRDLKQPQPSYASPDCPRDILDSPRRSPDFVSETAIPRKQRREPCFGWISESESEEEDPVKKEIEEDTQLPDTQLSSTRKRRIGWDVVPGGLHGM